MDNIVKHFDYKKLLTICKMPVIAVYQRPSDYPEHFVARVWDLDRPTQIVMICKTLDELRAAQPPEMTEIKRWKEDDPAIVETWV